MSTDTVEKYQRQLLEQTRSIYYDRPISEATEKAYLTTPRHAFVKRYRKWGTKEWHEVREENLEEHLATLCANKPLILYGEDDDTVPSTISQPSFVLRMLEMLQLRAGQTVRTWRRERLECGADGKFGWSRRACL